MADHGLKEAIRKYNFTDPDAHYTRVIDDLQWNVKCCGANNVTDWIELQSRIPASCCPKDSAESCSALSVATTTTQRSPQSPFLGNQPESSSSGNEASAGGTEAAAINSNVFEQGCVHAAVKALDGSLGPIGGVCLAVALFQLLGVVFAFCLGRAVRREYQVV